MVVVAVLAIFAGCSKPNGDSPFSVYRAKDNLRFSLGDKRDDVEKAIDDVPELIVEFEDDIGEGQVFERINYGYVAIDYDRAGNVLGLRTYENTWKLANGLKVGDSADDVRGKYPKEHMYTYKQNNDIYISYNENGDSIEFSEESPYRVRFAIENRVVRSIIVEKNVK